VFCFAGWVNLALLAGVQGAQTALLGPLKEVLESMTGGYEVMKEVVAALQDTERGKTASMTVLLQELQERQASKPSREEQERLRLEVRHRSCCQYSSGLPPQEALVVIAEKRKLFFMLSIS